MRKQSVWKWTVLISLNTAAFLGHLAVERFGGGRIGESIFTASDMYLVYVLPLYAAVHGVLSYYLTRSTVLPAIGLFVVGAGVYPLINAVCYSVFPKYNVLLMAAVYALIALVFSLLTWGVTRLFGKGNR